MQIIALDGLHGMLCRVLTFALTTEHGRSGLHRWTSWRLARLFGVRQQRILAIIAIKELEAAAGFDDEDADDDDDDAAAAAEGVDGACLLS